MAKEDIITGLDIGSTAVRVVVAQMGTHNNEEKMNIIGAAEVPSEGISKGNVVSIEDAVSCISKALEKAERMTGIPIEHTFVSINGPHITSQESQGVIAVAKADGEIREEDVARVIEAAQTVIPPQNSEILHVIPRNFSVDNQKNIKDPVGMTGIKLEVNAQIVQGLSSQIKNVTKCIYRTGVDIDDLVVSVLASAESVLTKRQKELGVALVNMGGTTTSLMVFEEGEVLHTKVLPIGAGHITNDIAIGLRTSIDVAEAVKLEFGSAVSNDIQKRENVDLHKISDLEDTVVPRKEVIEIVEARVEEIFSLIQKELKAIKRDGLLPAGIVMTGGGAKLPGIVEAAKEYFRLPASLGIQRDTMTAIDKVQDASFSTAVGLLHWGWHLGEKKQRFSLKGLSSFSHATDKMQKWFKSLLP